MNGRELFERWAPSEAIWSQWVKPVLFAAAHTPAASDSSDWGDAVRQAHGHWTPPRAGDTALVLDLPGPLALAMALECAAHGYRPVPLFNSCPGPNAVVPNGTVRAGLEHGIDALVAARLHVEASPAFVLDSRRMSGTATPLRFDNRWHVFPQDFPSASVLLARSIRNVVVVQDGLVLPREDLAHVLLRWQNAGVAILALDLAATPQVPVPIRVARPHRFGSVLQRLLVTLGLRRNSAGGFGAVVPEVTTSGSGFA
jgi:hypothetical protein